MRRLVLTAAAAAMLLAPLGAQAPAPQAPAGPNTWTVDTAHTAAGFSVKHMMVSTVRGTLGPVKGTVEYDGKSIGSLKADITIDVSGIDTSNDGRDKDLRSENFFDVAKFPTATFKSTRAVAGTGGSIALVGDLTLHGVTKEVTLAVDGPSNPITQGAAQRVGASATTTISRKDFGLLWNRMIEAGPVVSDEVRVTIDIEAVQR